MEDVFCLRLLGTVQVEREGEPVRGFRSRKALALLGYLAVQGQPIPRERLVDLLWEDKRESQGRSNLSWVLGRISSLLPGCLQADRHTVQFRPTAPCWLDTNAFEELEAQADAPSLAAVVELYRGEFLEGLYFEGCPEFELWLVGERERWRQRMVSVLGELVAHHSRRGEYDEGLRFARQVLALEPWREETHRQMMRLLAWSGQRSAALAQYEACRRALAEELGVEPAEETTQLYEQVRAGELEAPVPPPARLPDFGVPLLPFLEETQEPAERPIFVARERELARLAGFLEVALAGQGRVVFVTGEAGQGKTALIQEFVRRAQEAHPDLVVAGGSGNAHTGVGDPYLPFREVLGLLTGDVEPRWMAGAMDREQAARLWHTLPLAIQALAEVGPDLIGTFLPGAALVRRVATLGTVTPSGEGRLDRLKDLVERKAAVPGDPALQQSDLFEQYIRVLRALARERPLLLVLDDLQWADGGSVGLLFHLGRHIEGSRVLIVGAYRPTEVVFGHNGQRHPLASAVGEFKRRFGDVEVDLDQAPDRRFIDALLDAEPNRLGDGFREALYRQTRGQPLFTVELLRGMQEREELCQDKKGRWVEGPALDWETLPARVEAVIAERIDRLPAPLREVLRAASVEGETFTAEVVAQVLAADERETVGHLSRELDRTHRLVHVQGLQRLDSKRLSRYRFHHILFQRYLYNSLDPVERAYLHEAVGTTLETLYREAEEEEITSLTPQLAYHFQEAGITEKAVGYLHRAGDRARGLYALQEAIDHYQRALSLLKGQKAHEQTARTLMKLGLTYHIAFDFQRAHQAYEEGFALWQQVGEAQESATLVPAPHALRVDCPYPPLSLDPAMAEDVDSNSVMDQLFCGLVELSPELGIVPDVARSWEMSEGGRRYIFRLRDDVQWSDGTPVTAQDFEYAWKRVLDPATGSPAANLLYDVEGARAFHQGKGERADVGVRALDEVTLAVELEQPTGYFLHLLAYAASYPVPRHVVESNGEAWMEVEHIATNGPFRFEGRGQDGGLSLSRNPAYHGRFTGNVEHVELHPAVDIVARLQAYEADKLDTLFLWDPSEERERARRQHAGDYISVPWLATTYVGFDASRPPFNDPRVRRAFVFAVDRETFANVVTQGYAFPAAGGFIPAGMPGYSAETGLPYDPDQGSRLLAEAGYPDGRGFPPVEFLIDHEKEATSKYLAAQWKENLGVEVSRRTVEWPVFLDQLESEPPSVFLDTWVADYPDPDNFLRVSDAVRWTHWQDETYHSLVEGARRVTDQEERMTMYRQADGMLVEEAVIMPFLYWRSHMLVKPWVRKFPTSAIKWWFWKDVVIEPHE